MQSQLIVVLIVANLIALVVVPLIGGGILRLMFKLLRAKNVTFVRCWLAYLAAWVAASIVCISLYFVMRGGIASSSLYFDLAITVGVLIHLIVVPIVTRAGWGKAALAQFMTLVTYSVILLPLLWPLASMTRAQAQFVAAGNQARELGFGMRMHEDATKRLPANAIYSKDGKPLLSWRVAILPYIEQQPLYERFHLDEPWDSPHNMALLKEMPAVFAKPGDAREDGKTHWQVFVQTWPPSGGAPPGEVRGMAPFGPRMPMPPDAPVTRPYAPSIDQAYDGQANTIMIVDAAQAVPWTKPEDLPFGPGVPMPKLGAFDNGRFIALFFDGSYMFLNDGIDEAALRSLITADGGEVVPFSAFE